MIRLHKTGRGSKNCTKKEKRKERSHGQTILRLRIQVIIDTVSFVEAFSLSKYPYNKQLFHCLASDMHLGQHALTSDPLSTVQAEVAWREGTLYPVRVPVFMHPFQTSLSLKSQQKTTKSSKTTTHLRTRRILIVNLDFFLQSLLDFTESRLHTHAYTHAHTTRMISREDLVSAVTCTLTHICSMHGKLST